MTSPASGSTKPSDDVQQKLRTGIEHKQRGNEAFLSGDFRSALSSYHYSILYLSGLESRSILGLVGQNSGQHGQPEDLSSDSESESDPTSKGQKELSVVYSNMAACYLKLDNYSRAIQCAEKSIAADGNNVKAKYRKAQALRLGGDLYKARSFLQETISMLKKRKKGETAVVELERELGTLEKTIGDKEAMARNRWKGFLGKNPNILHKEPAVNSEGSK